MKKWENAEMKELSFSMTEYGAGVITEFDDIYVNAEGYWEGTMKPIEPESSSEEEEELRS